MDLFVCLNWDGREFRFTTYNSGKIQKVDIIDGIIYVKIKKQEYTLIIKANCKEGLGLIAPVNGKMKKNIKEVLNTTVNVILKENNNVIFSGKGANCGLEIVKEEK